MPHTSAICTWAPDPVLGARLVGIADLFATPTDPIHIPTILLQRPHVTEAFGTFTCAPRCRICSCDAPVAMMLHTTAFRTPVSPHTSTLHSPSSSPWHCPNCRKSTMAAVRTPISAHAALQAWQQTQRRMPMVIDACDRTEADGWVWTADLADA